MPEYSGLCGACKRGQKSNFPIAPPSRQGIKNLINLSKIMIGRRRESFREFPHARLCTQSIVRSVERRAAGGQPQLVPGDPALERHYSVREVAQFWGSASAHDPKPKEGYLRRSRE